MPFERKLPVNFVDELRDEFGNNIDASHVKKFATKYAVGYATVSRKLKPVSYTHLTLPTICSV